MAVCLLCGFLSLPFYIITIQEHYLVHLALTDLILCALMDLFMLLNNLNLNKLKDIGIKELSENPIWIVPIASTWFERNKLTRSLDKSNNLISWACDTSVDWSIIVDLSRPFKIIHNVIFAPLWNVMRSWVEAVFHFILF